MLKRTQHGMVLVSALLMLVVVTLLAVSMFRSFGIDEKIAGNVREKQLALSAAQSAQQFAEYWRSAGNGGNAVVCSTVVAASAAQVCSNVLPTVVANVAAVPWQINGVNVGVTYTPPNMTISTTGGAGTAAAPGDTITVRYATAGTTAGDNTINCLGATSTVAVTFINKFSLDGNGNLQCTLTVVTAGVAGAPTTTTLVSGVQNMQIVYGVQTNTASGNTSADTYLDAPAVTAGNYWSNLISASITLVFTNPLAGQPGQTSAARATIPFTRVICVMQRC